MRKKRFAVWMVVLTLILGLLLVYLAKLQWDWLDSFENFERVRAESGLSRSGFNLKVAIEQELEVLARCFTTLAGSESKLEDEVAASLQTWEQTSRWPSLLQDVYLFSRDPSGDPLLERFSSSKRFEPSPWPAVLEPLKLEILGKSSSDSAPRRVVAFDVFSPGPALLVRAHLLKEGFTRDTAGKGMVEAQLILHLDREFMAQEYFPELMAMFFPPPNFAAVKVAVVETSSGAVVYSNTVTDSVQEFSRYDFVIGLVDAGTDGEELPRIGMRPPKGQEAIPNWDNPPTVADHAWFRDLWASAYYSGHWQLYLARGGQSIAEATQASRWRALRSSFGVLALIGIVIAILVWLTRYAQRIARQQMNFIAGVSHEFRTPLAVLSAAGDNLADALIQDSQQLQEYGRVIQDESLRLREMVENVLHMARRNSPAPAPVLQPLEANRLVEDTLARMERLLEKEAFEVEADFPAKNLRILGDARALQSALLNLVSNALKYGKSARWLRVSVSEGGSGNRREVQIAVEDRGAGIEKKELPKLFDPFFRGRRAREEQIEGSGLGLALVQDVAKAHQGRVSVETTPGRGSRFTLHVPLMEMA